MLTSNEMAGQSAFKRGRSLYDIDQFEDTVKAFLEAVRLVPENSDYHAWLSRTYNRLENYAQALESANRSIQLESNNSLAYHQRGYVYEQQENYLMNFEHSL